MTLHLTYAIADLHGRFDLLEGALAAIAAHAAGPRTIVFLGDYVDRGPDSRKILDRLMAGAPAAERWICLKGNHEAMMAAALRGQDPVDHWLFNGGDATLRSFGVKGARFEARDIPAACLDWIGGLPLIHVDPFRVFVHAGVDPGVPLDRQTEHCLLWTRDNGPEGHGRHHVVHGHTPHRNGPQRLPGRTNLDTLAWQTGRLVVGVFDDVRAGGPVDLIEVRR